MRHETKEESRRRWKELRDIVNRWDPIGVFKMDPECPKDEYECVTGPLMRMLEARSSVEEITRYLEKEVREHFEIEPVPGAAGRCATESVNWFQGKWAS